MIREPSAPPAPPVVAIYLAAAAIFAALAARGLLTPLYAASIGADRFQIGLLFSASTLVAALLSLPSGLLSDRFGRRALLIFSIAVSAVSQVATAYTTSVPVLYVWQLMWGLAGGAGNAAIFAAVTDLVPARRLGRAMGWLTLSFQMGFLAGPALAGIALRFLDLRQDLLATTALLVLAVPSSLVAPGRQHRPERSLNLGPALRELAGRPAFYPVLLALVASSLVWGTLMAYLPVFGNQHLGLPASQVGYMLAVLALFNGASRIPAGRLVDRVQHKATVVLVGVTVFAAGMILLPHLGGFWTPTALLAVTVPFLATAFIAISVAFAALASPETRGVTMGLYSSVLFLGLALGPLAFGPIIAAAGYTAGFTACGVAAIALTVVMAVMHEPERRRRKAILVPPPAA
ncbi:MAG TPA: MFS transporter [Candidatus Acidoferrales bacterium]|nr:MFS transporter [Candidatus Acidoferrales bacterium]